MRWPILIVVLAAGILGYGYRHAQTHAYFLVRLAAGSAVQGNGGRIPEAAIVFLDAAGTVLARGQIGSGDSHVRLLHPDVGDCRDEELAAAFSAAARAGWQACFEQLSAWTADWADAVRQVDLETKGCAVRRIPVTVAKYAADWWFWWVPHPHIGGKPYTYYSATITADGNTCAEALTGWFLRRPPARLMHPAMPGTGDARGTGPERCA